MISDSFYNNIHTAITNTKSFASTTINIRLSGGSTIKQTFPTIISFSLSGFGALIQICHLTTLYQHSHLHHQYVVLLILVAQMLLYFAQHDQMFYYNGIFWQAIRTIVFCYRTTNNTNITLFIMNNICPLKVLAFFNCDLCIVVQTT